MTADLGTKGPRERKSIDSLVVPPFPLGSNSSATLTCLKQFTDMSHGLLGQWRQAREPSLCRLPYFSHLRCEIIND